MSKNLLALPEDYANWLAGLKQRISGARQRALLSANEEQIRLYYDIGCDIQNRQSRQGWGAKVIDRLSSDLRAAFPNMKGLSTSNLKYMRFFAQQCPDRLIGQQSADRLPWFHIVTLLTKVSDPAERHEAPMPQMVKRVADLEAKVNRHLSKMGFSPGGEWKVESGK